LAVLHAADRIGLYHHRRVAGQNDSVVGQLPAFREINRTGRDVPYKSLLVEQLSRSDGRHEFIVKHSLKRSAIVLGFSVSPHVFELVSACSSAAAIHGFDPATHETSWLLLQTRTVATAG
jgi:hypothetical protein